MPALKDRPCWRLKVAAEQPQFEWYREYSVYTRLKSFLEAVFVLERKDSYDEPKHT